MFQPNTQSVDTCGNRDILQAITPVAQNGNIGHLHYELAEMERKLIPLLNQVREMLGKRPIIIPRE